MDGDERLTREQIVQEANAIRVRLQSSTEPSERIWLKSRYQQLDGLLRARKANAVSKDELKENTRKCPYCAEIILIEAIKCRFCGEFLDGRPKSDSPSMGTPEGIRSNLKTYSYRQTDLSMALGLVGSVTLFLGAFMPIIRAPFVGSVNYFKNGEGDGVIVVILAIASLVLTLKKLTRWLYIPALLAGAMITFTFYNLRVAISDARKGLDDLKDLGPLGKSMGALAAEALQMEWGWAVLVVGAVLLFSASAVYKRSAA